MDSWHEYYRDPNKIEILIKYTFKLPSNVEDFNIEDHPIHVRQKNAEIYVNYHKNITISLYNDLKIAFEAFRNKKQVPDEIMKRNPSQYIVGYLGETLERINKEITNRKYKEGSVLLRTISQFDIYDVFIVNNEGEFSAILWPLPIPKHPMIATHYKEGDDVVFVRDLMDAMTEYFYFNLDECIRKVITSLENYFIQYELKVLENKSLWSRIINFRRTKFEKLVRNYVVEEYYKYKERDLKILRKNILFVYDVRNQIVHNRLRIDLDNKMFCKKAIGTLQYIYQSQFIAKDNKWDYIFGLNVQFLGIADMVIGLNLDHFAQAENSRNPETKIIENNDDMNEAIFNSLKITKSERDGVFNSHG